MDTKKIVVKVGSAKQAIATAEAELEVALNEIKSAPRADKVSISATLEDAFSKLTAARAALTELETHIEG